MRRTDIFTRIANGYARLFAVDEIVQSVTLQRVAWLLLFGWFVEFFVWSRFGDFTVNAVEAGRHLCWPFFQSCGEWYFLAQEPLGASHYLFYALLFALVIAAGWALMTRRFSLAHVLFVLFLLWELTVMLMAMRLAVNYWYFHLFFALLFLFPFGKLFLLRLGAVLLYFFSGLIKLNDTWLTGSYFTALQEGLYLIPDALIPVATNAVIFMELVLVWFLLSSRRVLRLPVVGLLFLFHVYSAIYVGFVYPAITLPVVLVLFLSQERSAQITRALHPRNIAGGVLIGAFVIVHAIPYVIAGDVRITGEGNRFGMYMFEANYQCQARATVVHTDGSEETETSRSFYANQRCDPYAHYFYLQERCARESGIARIAWTFDTSINGSPLMRIVDVRDACTLSYSAFSHNAWIRLPSREDVPRIAPVSKNRYLHVSTPGAAAPREIAPGGTPAEN